MLPPPLKLVNLEQTVQELQEEKVRLQEHSQRLEKETGALHAELETQSLTLGEHNTAVESKVRAQGPPFGLVPKKSISVSLKKCFINVSAKPKGAAAGASA